MPVLFPLFIHCCFNKHADGQRFAAQRLGKREDIELGLHNVLFNDDFEDDLSPESDSNVSSDSEKTEYPEITSVIDR
jgi:hypothetical protein